MSIDELLEKYRDENLSKYDTGTKFEWLMKNFLLTYPVYRGMFSDVWLWNEFPFREKFGTVDLGIDIVAKTGDGEFWAVQCKFYAESTPISKSAVDTFLATSSKTFDGDKKFSARLWISTSDNLTDNAEITLQNQSPEVLRIGMDELRKTAVDWEKLDAGTFGDSAVKNVREPLQHQLDAINAAQNHFQNHNRGKLIMACGTGKTYTSLKIAEKLYPNGKILFLVPSISLLGQILHEWATFAENPLNYICVCSDETVSKKTDDEITSVNLPLPATTNPDEISRRFKTCAGFTAIFSTYQSLDKISAAKINFDLIICDEAHRTTGYGTNATNFTAIHNENFIHGDKRLYMTATPRLYTSEAKKKAADNDLLLWSMDDAEIYGEEFYHIGFGDAVEKNLLSDYKVLILTVDKPLEVGDKNISADDKAKITGCINALNKKLTDIEVLGDPKPMKTAVGFCSRIKDSEKLAEEFKSQGISAVHVDGSMSGNFRSGKLAWLKNTPENECRIITNARCLSEGVDVPSLDAVLFLASKKSQVDIVQAVGRVMRKSPDKKYGYIIIPIIVPLDKSPEDALAKGEFDIVWKILNALRAHDSRMDIFIEEIKLHNGKGNKNPSDKIFVTNPDQIPLQTLLNFDELKNLIYARMVERVGNRRYWEQWATDIAQIAERHTKQIKNLIAADKNADREFGNFVYNLQQNLNPSVTPEEAIEMLAQHIVTKPVFEALFKNYSFVNNNPVSQALENILAQIDTADTEEDSAQLQKFYESVRERCQVVKTAADRVQIINELYEKFFRLALKKTSEKLGIVYTPVEVVDFILRSVDAVLKKNFSRTLSDKNIHVLDPFTGTGTFITRLIQSGLIKPKDLLRKYFAELHANEIILLTYYIAAINIENAFHDAAQVDSYQPFEGICFTDTFQAYERDENAIVQTDFKAFRNPLEENSERVKNQINTRIEVIVGNPPYSVGQKSANDNNQNQYYKNLEARIAATYTAKTDASNKARIYDSYIKAFRWASDRVTEGVIGFVTNAGWLDNDSMDGLRTCFAQEFSEIYIYNLRGNQRTQGETSRREGGKIFGSGSRAPIAVTILVKAPHVGDAKIFYRDIGDYLTREQKLAAINNLPSVLSDGFELITPNERGDWINQRGDDFETFIPLAPDKKFDGKSQSFFVTYSLGIATGRDVWSYNFSRPALEKNIRTTIDYYNTHEPTDIDPTKFVWNSSSVQNKNRGLEIEFDAAQIVDAVYRPFCKENLYYEAKLIERRYQIPKFFPTGREENLLICVSGIGGEKNLSVFITDKIIDLNALDAGTQCFPLYWYEESLQGNLFGEQFERRDGITDWILHRAAQLYGGNVTREDIFYYVYGFLHLPSYHEKFANELKKSLPRIILVADAKKFWQLSRAGRELAEIHLNYESQPAPDGVEVIGGGDFRVNKMRLSKDKTELIYNDHITIKNIPPRCFDYVVNGRSPLEWVIERYQIKTDKASGITNNPNDWATEHDNPRYILDLLLSSITVSLKTLDIVENLPAIEL